MKKKDIPVDTEQCSRYDSITISARFIIISTHKDFRGASRNKPQLLKGQRQVSDA